MKTNSHTADVIIIGGGIHGCSAALHIARRGLKVIVLEKDYVARHASGVNAGGVRRLGRNLAEVPIAQAAWELWQDMRALVDDDCGYRSSRYLKVARNETELSEARSRVGKLNAMGFKHEEVIDRETLRELLPAASESCIGALHVDADGAASPFRTTLAFKRRAEALGVRFEEGMPVLGVKRQGDIWILETPVGQFVTPSVVNTCGAWGGKLASWFGDNLPIEARAPMLVITSRMPVFVEPVVGALGAALSFKQYDNGTILIGGGVCGAAYPDENRTRLDLAGLTTFLKTARAIIPAVKHTHVVRAWAGIEGYTADKLPVIGRGEEPGIVHAFGFSAHGFQLAPAVGSIVSHLVMGETPNLPIEPFRVGRFDALPMG